MAEERLVIHPAEDGKNPEADAIREVFGNPQELGDLCTSAARRECTDPLCSLLVDIDMVATPNTPETPVGGVSVDIRSHCSRSGGFPPAEDERTKALLARVSRTVARCVDAVNTSNQQEANFKSAARREADRLMDEYQTRADAILRTAQERAEALLSVATSGAQSKRDIAEQNALQGREQKYQEVKESIDEPIAPEVA